MNENTWVEVDTYLNGTLLGADEALEHADRSAAEAGLPPIAVSPAQGRFLGMLASITGARRILEIGTLGGYSAICLARALPSDGKLVTLEYEPRHAEVAAANLEFAGLADRAEIRVGAALDNLAALEKEGAGPFDLFFIDADKVNNPRYVEWAVRLGRKGSVIVLDNVVRQGDIADASSEDTAVVATREALELVGSHPRLEATALQTVSGKSYDGFMVARIVD